MAKLAYPVQLLLTGVSYYAAGWASLRAFAFVNTSASPVWPPTGIAIGVLLLGGYRFWPAIFAGAVGFNFATSGDVSSSLVIGAGNTLEAMMGAWIAKQFCGGKRAFSKAPRTLTYGFGMLIPTAFAASVGVLALLTFGLAPPEAGQEIWLTWWLGDFAGALVVAPLIVLWRKPRLDRESGLLYGATALFGAAAFLWLPPETILALPLLIAWASLRQGPREMAAVTGIIAAFAVFGTLQGHGIFTGGHANQSLLELQVFLAFFSMMTLVLAAGSIERRASGANIRRIPFTLLAIVPLLFSVMLAHTIVRPSYDFNQETAEEEHISGVVNNWVDALEQNQARLESTAAFIHANPDLTREEFHHYVDQSKWIDLHGGIQAIGFNRYVTNETLAEFQAHLDNDPSLEGLGYPRIEATPGVVIDYLSPIAGNEAAFGFDISSEPTRNAAIQTAIETGEVSVTAPLVLVQEQEGAKSTLNMMPVYTGNPANAEERREQFYGVVVSVHRGVDMAAHIQFDGAIEDLEADIFLVGGEHENGLHQDFTYAGREYRVHADRPDPDPLAIWAPTFVLASGGLLSIAAAMAVYAYDSTTRRAHEEAGRMTARLQEAQNIEKIGAWEWDIPNDEVIWSPMLYEVFGQNPDTFKADFDGYVACLHPEDREQIQGIIYQAFETGEPFSTDHRVVWPDGTVRWVHGQGEVEAGPKGPIRMRGTAQDVTERIEAEEAKRHAATQEQELSNLRRVDQFKTQFLNTAAHELRTPLSPILMQLHVLKKEAEDHPVGEKLDILDRNIRRLSELINDFLTSSQFQAGRLAINPETASLRALVGEAVESFQPTAKGKGIALNHSHEGSADFNMDAARIQQVLYNLLSNALKFTEEGTINVQTKVDAHKARIMVTDTGRGMQPEDLDKLFTPFTQVHNPMTLTERGSGLGLYICKAIVEGHEGKITAESKGLGEGSTFTIILPAPPEG